MATPPQFIWENGLRKVVPYYYTDSVRTKGRWVGRTVYDVFTTEFRNKTEDYYRKMILAGDCKIRRNPNPRTNEVISGERLFSEKLKELDSIERLTHKHEPLAYLGPDAENGSLVDIIHEDESVLVINKPSGVPIHPTRDWYYNTLTEIIKLELGHTAYPCYRLDKLTSGVLIFAKSSITARRIQNEIRDRTVHKEYIARVGGKFPDAILCEDPIVVYETVKGYTHGASEAKEAKTRFERVSFNEQLNQSIVKCIPLTGRTHQIRIHLRDLGYPIVNDPLYSSKGLMDKKIERSESEFEKLAGQAKINRESLFRGRCEECSQQLYKDPSVEEMILWLHARRWESNSLGIAYEAPYPAWASF